jgi:hypothetical protein
VSSSSLTSLQVEATRLFFSLPDSAGFAVAGGAALIARGLIARPTNDVDLFLLEAGDSTADQRPWLLRPRWTAAAGPTRG